jgi:hypothetical protein
LEGAKCSVCNLDAKLRKIGEELIKSGVGVRDVASFTEWWASRFGTPITSRAAWQRHSNRAEPHFDIHPRAIETPDGEALDLDVLVDKLFAAWQKANKGVTPSAKEIREWLRLRAAIKADMEARKNADQLSAMLMGAGHKVKEKEDAVQVPGRTEGSQS